MDVIGFLYVTLGSSTVQLHDSLGNAHVHVQRLVSVVKMPTVFKHCNTEEQHSVVHFFCVQKDSMQRIFIEKLFLFTVGSVCHIKRFTTVSRNSLKDVRKSQMMPDQLRKWLRQQSKDLYAAGFDTLIKHWDKCINVAAGYVEKYMFFFQV
jgi:hypothetical protein